MLMARSTSSRWITGISSWSISTPRSPLATITASDSRMIASASSTADRVSILATTSGGWSPSSLRSWRTSSALRTNDWATMSAPASRAHAASSWSLGVRAGRLRRSAGTLTPARDRM